MEALEAELKEYIAAVAPPDAAAMARARARQDALAKPPGSLGRLEELGVQLAGITGRVNNELPRKHLLVFAADNGVVAEGVASAPASVTLMQTLNLTRAKTGASVLAKRFGCGLTVCDVGVDAEIRDTAVLDRKIARGTGNIARGPAMSREQALAAICAGARLARGTAADVLGVGEMGIGNTTTSAAVLSALTGLDPAAAVGRGG
ncbi:MAG: nicotinate-nucleotide--dimethylbenzimidazole phosphoribosyltransferase, partial [Oscillospiraceae bacterium]|nr:nicotinate-nucleotide--dimethylbenzimidazole phosphoribosyltransferase [Oscillospiraceae bacterium]